MIAVQNSAEYVKIYESQSCLLRCYVTAILNTSRCSLDKRCSHETGQHQLCTSLNTMSMSVTLKSYFKLLTWFSPTKHQLVMRRVN